MRGATQQRTLTKPNKQMKKTLLFIAMLFAGMLIAGTIDEQTRQLESQPNTINK
jgi:hypothetical protein